MWEIQAPRLREDFAGAYKRAQVTEGLSPSQEGAQRLPSMGLSHEPPQGDPGEDWCPHPVPPRPTATPNPGLPTGRAPGRGRRLAGDLAVGDTGGSSAPGLHHPQTLPRKFPLSSALRSLWAMFKVLCPARLPDPVNDYRGGRLPKSHRDRNGSGTTSPNKHKQPRPGQGASSRRLLTALC